MGFSGTGLSATEVLAAITDDSVRFTGADINVIQGQTLRHGILDFWSEPIAITIPTPGATQTLSNVVIPNLSDITPLAAYAMMAVEEVSENAGSGNGLNTLTHIQVDKAAAGWIDAIKFLADDFTIAANARGHQVLRNVGSYDIISRVAMNATTNFQWTSVASNSGSLLFRNLRTGVRVVF